MSQENSFAKETIHIALEDEMRQSYLDYAMSVIVGRALPDVRDGLKPVHRRVLYAMNQLNNDWNKAYKKSARVVGDVIGKYHPHGDTAVYDTIVRMAQGFSLRYPLVDGQGNFGSIDGDSAAAMRYTEVRLSKVAHQLLNDLEQETVNFSANYDGSEQEPNVLPASIPNLLVNGSSGIAVGMATNIAPHNLNEVINASLYLLKNPDCEIDELIKHIPAPDFPTAALIYGTQGAKEAYRTGRGRIVMRAKTHVEDLDKGQRQAIIIDELPYQVNKRTLLEKIASLVNEKLIEGISDIRDESDQSGMRVVLELKKNIIADVVLNHLYKQTSLQDSFSINMVALANGQPKLMNLKEVLEYFLIHRREVIVRRTRFLLKKAEERAHLLEGLAVALANLDNFIQYIRQSATPQDAKAILLNQKWLAQIVQEMLNAEAGFKYQLSEIQAEHILQMRLQRLTAMEQNKVVQEYSDIMSKIKDLKNILNTPTRVNQIIETELIQSMNEFGDERRSQIMHDTSEINVEDLITPQDMVVTLSHMGYIKSQPLSEYRSQKRGGRGKQGTGIKDDDWIETLLNANTHDSILCFSNLGRLYWLKVYEVPQGSRIHKGKPINNLIALQGSEKITAILKVQTYADDLYITMVTAQAVIKRVKLSEFSNPRSKGITAINLDDDDYLIGVDLTDNHHDIMLFNNDGKATRFDEQEVRAVGRTARGVRGMRLEAGQSIISLLVAPTKNTSENNTTDNSENNTKNTENNFEEAFVLCATEKGFGKITAIEHFTKHHRGGSGVIAIANNKKNGKLIGATLVTKEDDVMLITNSGVVVRTKVAQIRQTGRSAQGVTLINLDEGALLSSINCIAEKDEDMIEGETSTSTSTSSSTSTNSNEA